MSSSDPRFEVHKKIARGGYYWSVFDTRQRRYTSFPVGTSGMPRRQTPRYEVAVKEAELRNLGV